LEMPAFYSESATGVHVHIAWPSTLPFENQPNTQLN